MKEQWKKHDSDAKLLQNVEEGRPQPIKIELPISAFGLKQDGCCTRLITLLRVAILFLLLIILSWTAVTLYSNYYPRQLEIDEQSEPLVSNQHDYSNEENKLSFRNKVYAMLNEQDVGSNEIDSFIATPTPSFIATTQLSEDGSFDDEKMRITPEMKNYEDITIYEFPKINSASLETLAHDAIYKKRFNLENASEKSINEEGVSSIDQTMYQEYVTGIYEPKDESESKPADSSINEEAYTELSSIPKEGSVKLLNNRGKSAGEKESNEIFVIPSLKKEGNEDIVDPILEKESNEVIGIPILEKESNEDIVIPSLENESNEAIVIPSLEDENTHQVDQDFKNDMEFVEVDDLDELMNDIANAMGLLQQPSSEVDQSNEESVAVIQEEIKKAEKKLEILDLDETSSKEETLKEESAAIVQEEIKNNDEITPIAYLVDFESTSEEENPDAEAVAVIQEEIKSDSDQSFQPVWEVVDDRVSVEDYSTEKAHEKVSSEDTSLNDLYKNTRSDISSVEDISREFLPSETINRFELPTYNPERCAIIAAILLEPFVGYDYNLVHWYYEGWLADFDPTVVDYNYKSKVYAAKVLYNPNITEYVTDMQMWLSEMTEESYLTFSSLMDPEKSIQAETFLQKQIADKFLLKFYLKEQYDLKKITFYEVWKKIDESNSNHIKSWFIATHPSVHQRELGPFIIASMTLRRSMYPWIKDDEYKVINELMHENTELSLLKINFDDFNEDPIPSIAEQYLMLLKQEPEKFNFDYLPNDENELLDERNVLKKIQPTFNSMKEVGKESEYVEEPNSESYETILEAMRKVGEEYVPLIKNDDKNEEKSDSKIKNVDEDDRPQKDYLPIYDKNGEMILPPAENGELQEENKETILEVKRNDDKTEVEENADSKIKNVVEDDRSQKEYLPIYDKNGEMILPPAENGELQEEEENKETISEVKRNVGEEYVPLIKNDDKTEEEENADSKIKNVVEDDRPQKEYLPIYDKHGDMFLPPAENWELQEEQENKETEDKEDVFLKYFLQHQLMNIKPEESDEDYSAFSDPYDFYQQL